MNRDTSSKKKHDTSKGGIDDLKLSEMVIGKSLTSRKKNKKIFLLLNNKKAKINFEIKDAYIPYGAEEYKGKMVLNIEINPEKDNNHHNIFASIENFENDLENIHKNNKNESIPNIFMKDIEDKKYYRIMKTTKSGTKKIRCHFTGTTKKYLDMNGLHMPTDLSNIRNDMKCDLKLQINVIWISDTQYGILINIKEIVVRHLNSLKI